MGGGIHGHPQGTMEGARAARQAVSSVMEGVPIEEYSKEHPELRTALDYFQKKS
jgi:ribulose 1,5-bisphosphate carboxylase large subunit-like protein